MTRWSLEVYDEDADTWKVGFSGLEEDDFEVIGYPLNQHEVRALSGRGRDRTSLVQVDLETGREEVLYEHPEVDVEYAWAEDATNELVAAYAWGFPQARRFAGSKLETHDELGGNHR